jgi:hypothetical protein
LVETGLLFSLERLALSGGNLTDVRGERIAWAEQSNAHRRRFFDLTKNSATPPGVMVECRHSSHEGGDEYLSSEGGVR